MNLGRVLAAMLACAMIVTACGAPATSPTGSASAGATPPGASAQTPTSSPSSPPSSPAPSQPEATSWPMTASFDTHPQTSYVTDVTAWSRGFIAVGSTWDSEFHVSQEMPALWTSPDGESWTEQPAELGADDASLTGIAPLPDDRLLLVGRVPGLGAVPDQPVPATAAWVSEDGSAWQAVDLPIAEDLVIDSFDHGPKGYVLAGGGEIWYSADGTNWARTYEGAVGVVAGEEGFVATLIPAAAGPSSVVASADGQTWITSAQVATPLLDVAALGGDWVATGYDDEGRIMVWHSANGLDWAPMVDVNDLTGPDGPKTGRAMEEAEAINGASLTGGAGHAFLTLTNNHCCAQMAWNYGVWGSADGSSWAQVIEGDAFVSSVASDGEATVLAGHLGRGDDAAFWIGEGRSALGIVRPDESLRLVPGLGQVQRGDPPFEVAVIQSFTTDGQDRGDVSQLTL